MGAYYELFHNEERRATGKGGPSLPTHMHGHYMAMGHIRNPGTREWAFSKKSTDCVMPSQAYTMYRRREFLDLKGSGFEECRFYPHPEGFMPLKVWMTGGTCQFHPGAWHIHGMYSRTYAASEWEKKAKIKEYGGFTWSQHGARNVLMIAYILGGQKWFNICLEALRKKHGDRRMKVVHESAVRNEEMHKMHDWLLSEAEMTLDEVLTMTRKNRILGMENWHKEIGPDPI
jgi:hypothetical protein